MNIAVLAGFLASLAASTTLASGTGTGTIAEPDAQVLGSGFHAYDGVYTNAQAFARGLPPLRPHRRMSHADRAWNIAKRAAPSIIPRDLLITYEEPEWLASIPYGPLPNPYKGFTSTCTYGGCGWLGSDDYAGWTPQSPTHTLFFWDGWLPSFTIEQGTFRIKSLYCAQGAGSGPTVTLEGLLDGEVIFSRLLACTQNNVDGTVTANPPTLNSFANMPFIDTYRYVTDSTAVTQNGWAIDDVSFTIREPR